MFTILDYSSALEYSGIYIYIYCIYCIYCILLLLLFSISYDEGHVIVSYIIIYAYMYYIIIMIVPSFIISNPHILIKKSLMHAQIHDNNSLPRGVFRSSEFFVSMYSSCYTHLQ